MLIHFETSGTTYNQQSPVPRATATRITFHRPFNTLLYHSIDTIDIFANFSPFYMKCVTKISIEFKTTLNTDYESSFGDEWWKSNLNFLSEKITHVKQEILENNIILFYRIHFIFRLNRMFQVPVQSPVARSESFQCTVIRIIG